MTHLVVLFHTLDHKDSHSTKLSSTLEFDNSFNVDDCSICDIYIDVDFSELQTMSYSFIAAQFKTEQYLNNDDQFKPIVLYLKQSRSPPCFIYNI